MDIIKVTHIRNVDRNRPNPTFDTKSPMAKPRLRIAITLLNIQFRAGFFSTDCRGDQEPDFESI